MADTINFWGRVLTMMARGTERQAGKAGRGAGHSEASRGGAKPKAKATTLRVVARNDGPSDAA